MESIHPKFQNFKGGRLQLAFFLGEFFFVGITAKTHTKNQARLLLKPVSHAVCIFVHPRYQRARSRPIRKFLDATETKKRGMSTVFEGGR